ncbi:MAG TPA: N-acetylmuramoyl-L-alanine amidase [bacterium]|nr:N-acetylmuramoyl-L-alanine amidase [bacterium]
MKKIWILALMAVMMTGWWSLGVVQAKEDTSVPIKSDTVTVNMEGKSENNGMVQFDIPVWLVGFKIYGQELEADKIHLSIKSMTDDKWIEVDTSEETGEKEDVLSIEPIALNMISQEVNYSVVTDENVVVNKIDLVGIDSYDYEGVVPSFANIQSRYQKADRLNIINRDEWGADESLMFWDDDMEHKNIQQIVIHHTAGNDNSPLDPAAVIRGIYYYHTVTNGWGDIGYNYIIDQYGNVYEGRKGGLGVVGAHAYGFNSGSVGISVLGNYETVEPSSNSIDGLINTIAYVSFQTGLDLTKQAEINGKKYNTIVGHRDVQATACPGENFYQLLSQIRQKSIALLNGVGKKQYEARLVGVNWPEVILAKDEEKDIEVTYQNIGNGAWLNGSNEVMLAAVEPVGRMSSFAGSNWQDKSNVVEAYKYTVMPNEQGIFKFRLKGNSGTGEYAEKFGLIYAGKLIEGSEFTINVDNLGVKIDQGGNKYGISPAHYRYEYLGSEKITVVQGSKATVNIKLKNVGDNIWYKDGLFPLHLGTVNEQDRNSVFYNADSWLTTNRLTMLEDKIMPQEVGMFSFVIDSSLIDNGTYQESFRPVLENIAWIDGEDIKLNIDISEANNRATMVAKSDQVPYMVPGELVKVWVDLKNAGNLVWQKDSDSEIMMGTAKPNDRSSDFYNKQYWPSTTRVTKMNVDEVQPGDVIRMEMILQAPEKNGSYQECFTPVLNSGEWLNDGLVCWDILVQK